MKWNDVVAEVAAETGISKGQARRTLDAFRTVISRRLAAGESVPLPGIGTWSTRVSGERVIRSIQSGRTMWIGARRLPDFRAARALRRALTGGSEPVWKNADHQQAWRLSRTLLDDLSLYNKGTIPDITASTSDAEVHAACAACFGADWDRAVETYDSKTPQAVREAHDHIASSARRLWAASS